MDKGITKENLMLIMPPALTRDSSIMALAEADAEALAARLAEIDRVRIISNIDGLDEDLLDILAYDFKVDWWDADYSVEEKRRTLKSSWMVHKKLGTKAAVETALSAIYPGASVEEWFQYGGEPYHFRVKVEILDAEYMPDKHKRVLERIEWYKSLRSHMDRIWYVLQPICFAVEEQFVFRDFHVWLHANNWNCVFLNGDYPLDGSWLLDQSTGRLYLVRTGIRTAVHMPHQLGPSYFAAGGIGVRTQERIPVRLRMGVYRVDNMGGFVRLDGNHKLDGSWLLDQRPRSPRFVFGVIARAVEPQERLWAQATHIRVTHRTESIFKLGHLSAGVLPFCPLRERVALDMVPGYIFREQEDAPQLRCAALRSGWKDENRTVLHPPALRTDVQNREMLWTCGVATGAVAQETTCARMRSVSVSGCSVRNCCASSATLRMRHPVRMNGAIRMDGTYRFNGGDAVELEI